MREIAIKVEAFASNVVRSGIMQEIVPMLLKDVEQASMVGDQSRDN